MDQAKDVVEHRVEFLTTMLGNVKDELKSCGMGHVVNEYESALGDVGSQDAGDDNGMYASQVLKTSYDQVKAIVGLENMGSFNGLKLALFRGDETDENREVRAYLKDGPPEIAELFHEEGDSCFGLDKDVLDRKLQSMPSII